MYLSFDAVTSTSGEYGYLDSASIYEVTPGCVATGSLGPDGWTKSTNQDAGGEEYAILIVIVIAAIGTVLFYLKGYRRNR